MSLETIVSKMIAANEPESNIAKVIKYHKKDSSKINCKKCNHSWKVADGGDDLYMCHECGYNNNKSPLKAVATCPDGSKPDEFGKCNEEKELTSIEDKTNDFTPEIELTKTPEQVQQQEIEVAELPQSGTVETTLDNSEEEKEEPVRKDEWQQLTKEQEGEIYKKYGVGNLMPDGTFYKSGTGPVWDQRAEQAVSEIQEANNQSLKQDLIKNSDGFTQRLLTKAGISLSEKDGDFIPKVGKGILNIVSSADGMAFVRANNTIQKFNDRVKKEGLKDNDTIEYGGYDETQGAGGTLEGFIRKKINPTKKGTVLEARKYYNEKFIEPLVASEKYQKLISSLGNVEILDGKGNFTDKAQQVAGEQLPQVLGALFMAPIVYQETTTAAMEIINRGVEKEVGDKEFSKLSAEEKANVALRLLDDKKINLEPAIENGVKGAGLDIVSNLFVGSQAVKFIPKKFIRQIVSKNINKELFKQAGKSVLRGAGSVVGEEITEFTQESLSKAAGIRGTDITPTGDMRRSASLPNLKEGFLEMTPKERKELAAQTAIGVGSIGGAGKSITTAATGIKDVILDVQANYDVTTTRAILNEAKKAKELQYIKGEIKADVYNDFLNELEAGEDFVNDTKLKNLTGDRKNKAFDAAVQLKKTEKTIENTKKSIEEAENLGKNTALSLNVIPDLKADLEKAIKLEEKANFDIVTQISNESRETDGRNLENWVNKNTKKKVTRLDTVEQAKEHIEKYYPERLKDKEVINLLEGDFKNNAIKLGDEAIIVEDNISENQDNGDIVGTNAVHHEVTHFILDQATATELNALKKGVEEELSKSNDPKVQRVLEFARDRSKQYSATDADGKKGLRGKALAEEFFAALSDGMRDIEVRDFKVEDVGLFRGIGSIFQKTLSGLTDNELSFDKMNASNTLQFIKKFNKFNSKDTKIKLDAPKVKGIDVDEVKASKPLTKEELATEFNTLEKGKIPDQTAVQAAYAYEPLAKSIANTMYRDYPGFKESGFTRDDFAMELTFGQGANSLLGLAKSYDPKVGSIGGYFSEFLPQRAKAVMNKFIGKSATNAGTSLDTTEARELKADEKVDIEAKDAVGALAVPKNILDTVKDDKIIDLMVLSAENEIKKLSKTATGKQKIAARKKGTESIIKKQIVPKLKQELLKTTKNNDDFKKYLDKNWEGVGNAFLNNTDIGKIRNEDTRELLESFEDNGFTKEDIVNYFTDTSLAKNTLSDRKNVGLINAIVAEITDELRIEAAKKDPATAADFKKSTGIPLASRPLSEIARQNAYLKANPNAPQTLPYSSIEKLIAANSDFKKVPVLDTPDKAKDFVIGLKDFVFGLPVEIVTKTSFYNPSGRIFPNYDKNKKYINLKTGKQSGDRKSLALGFVKNESEGRKKFEAIEEAFNTERDALIKDLKKNSTVKLYGAAIGFTARDFAKSMGKTPAEILDNKEYIINQNAKAVAMHEQVWRPIYEFVKEDPKNNAATVGFLMKNGSKTATHWHRAGIEMVGTSKKFEGGVTYEHAMPMVSAYLALIDSAANGVPFDISYPAIQSNYKLLALSDKDDKKLNGPYKAGMGDGWNFYTGNWKERYFNPTVAIFDGGINPANILDLNGENYAKKYNIDNKGFSTTTKALASKPLSRTFYEDGDGVSEIEAPLSREFNKMLENTKGIKAEAVYSDARAAKMGVKKGFQAFVPYSAEDFLGLVYPTLGKGEQGNKDLKWWKDNVMNPYNDGMTEFESSKQAAMIEWNQIKDQIKNTPNNLGKEAVRDFSNEDAIRVYLWDQQDAAPSDLSKKDIKALVDHVKKSPELTAFAGQINSLNVNGYPDPTKGWLAGTITTDLVNHVNTSTRSEMLAPWQEAIDDIYTDDNKNKLKATYGEKYIEALDDVLYRMKTGRNRPSGANRITNNWLNWVNDSVGTIMFFNQRSAILQTISSINFINWSDNNPGAAAKAFANQKQYWSDFSYLFNSDFLKQRRSGLKTDVNADEIAQQAAGSTNKVRAGLSWLLKKGFLPTQIADSFAIASGGSTFYRNRVGSLVKSGMSKVDAEKQAFADFRDSANESQQSSDPSRVSMEQASSLGRVILAFANTPIQYTRLTKRATQDLLAGRGDWKSNVSKILYYGAVQNIIFTTLQQAMFGMLFADDDDEFQNNKKDTAVFNVANSTVDTFLRGSGVAGAFVAMLKNMALEIKRQKDSRRPDYGKVADKLFSVSPPIDSKFRKLKSAGRTFTYKQELEKMRNKGVAIDNPAFMAIAQVISAFGNIPADRVLRKLNNIVEATNNKNAIWQRMALIMGWGQWELGITGRKTEEAKQERDSFKALEKSITRATKAIAKEKAKEAKKAKKKTPIKALEAGVLGEANKDGSIVVAKGLSKEKRKEVIKHEKIHQKEIKSGKLDYDDNFVYYGKKKYERKNGNIIHNGKAKIEGDHSLPWEKVAHKH